jgi:hypothetical protein
MKEKIIEQEKKLSRRALFQGAMKIGARQLRFSPFQRILKE